MLDIPDWLHFVPLLNLVRWLSFVFAFSTVEGFASKFVPAPCFALIYSSR
jgi:hypothetical protein